MRRSVLAAALVASASALLAPAANAATVRVGPSFFAIGGTRPPVAIYQARPGESNAAIAEGFDHRSVRWLRLRDARVRVTVGARCQVNDPRRSTGRTGAGSAVAPRTWIYCRLPAVPAARRNIPRVIMLLGDGADVASSWTGRRTGGAVIVGQGGWDIIAGGGVRDVICTAWLRLGTEVWRYPIDHGACSGDDAERDPDFAQNVAVGGGGDDIVLGGDGPDGLGGEEGVDDVFGNGGDDAVLGGPGPDVVDGGDGDDMVDFNFSQVLWADSTGDDEVRGGAGHDIAGYSVAPVGITASDGLARVAAGGDMDSLAGIEELYGSQHDDVIDARLAGRLVVHALGGDDVVDVSGDPTRVDGAQDSVDCGGGVDHMVGDSQWASFDGSGIADGASACESVALNPLPPGS